MDPQLERGPFDGVTLASREVGQCCCLVMLLGWLPWMLLGAAGLYLGLRAVRAFERCGSATAELAALHGRILALEETAAARAHELEHLAEGQ